MVTQGKFVGTVTGTTVKGLTIEATEVGTNNEYKIRLATKDNLTFREVPVDATVDIVVTVRENPANE